MVRCCSAWQPSRITSTRPGEARPKTPHDHRTIPKVPTRNDSMTSPDSLALVSDDGDNEPDELDAFGETPEAVDVDEGVDVDAVGGVQNGDSEQMADVELAERSEAIADPSTTAPGSEAPQRRRFRRLIRLTVLVVVAAGLSLVAYLAWPSINERYIQPVETTAADLTTVQDRLNDSDARLDGLDTTTGALDAQIGQLGTRLDAVETAQGDAAERLDGIDGLIETQTGRLDDLDELAATLGDDLATTNTAAARQLDITRAAELMSRARLFLYQANYGLAIADLASARNTLEGIEDDPTTQTLITAVIARLDRSIANLPQFPVIASGDLDIAWQTLLSPESDPLLLFSATTTADDTGTSDTNTSGVGANSAPGADGP